MLAAVVLALSFRPAPAAEEIRVGSKKFTESVILGEAARLLLRDAGFEARHRRELGGTAVLWNALIRGDIDVYPEYTGTLRSETLARLKLKNDTELKAALAERGLRMSAPLGFNNTYALGMTRDRAKALGIRRISDLLDHPGLSFGFTNEFMDRSDGWPALKRRYGLPQTDVRGLDHDLAYRGLVAGNIDVVDLYSTDAEIAYYRLEVLADDRNHFPAYHAVFLYRADLETRAPGAVRALERLAGRLDEGEMSRLNTAVKLKGVSESRAAAGFLSARLGLELAVTDATLGSRLWRRTAEHLTLVLISLAAAIAISVPLGIIAFRRPAAGRAILGTVGVIQTLPALALLVFMIPLLGIGGPPAMVALFLYSLLPIVRNTHAGLAGISAPLRHSALALGMGTGDRLMRIELPLALPVILAGIKTAAVINVGTATLGALIGAGGYGQPILTGIRLDSTATILEGAIPAALLALAVQGGFELAERRLIPRGLRHRAMES
ncbi:MAG TPA: glycine betaine ABC transporter substrate-binding protein [Alphaproteobacteria bacterium]|nr:glycine betaine ABC transporter substrate-binding protein [Alphaproteobacteria bacterium]